MIFCLRAYYKQFPHPACDDKCKNRYLCTMRSAVNSAVYNFCNFENKEEEKKYKEWQLRTYNKC